jgi:deoxyadenosine/deoxycytidine kinase
MQHKSGIFSADEWQVYIDTLTNEKLSEPSLIICLDAEVDTVFSRLQRRGVESEVDGYTKQYFEELKASYCEASKIISSEIHTLDWNSDKELDDGYISIDDCKNFVERVWSLIWGNVE